MNLKLFALISVAGLILYILSSFLVTDTNVPLGGTKYILQWTSNDYAPLSFLGHGFSEFEKHRCKYANCFVTHDRSFLDDLGDFHAVLFHGKEIVKLSLMELPQVRSQKQKYVFVTLESAHNYPICDQHYDGYFNWTWTYRLQSDIRWRYFRVYDHLNNAIAPEVNMIWPSTYQPIDDEVRKRLNNKSKAVAWFVSNCKTKSVREKFVESVSEKLKVYNLMVDTYGSCGSKLQCPRSDYKHCNQLLENDYYFYFSFENSFDEDYVTEKLLTGLDNYAVPVVFGGANYSRFLPPGSYLDGRQLGAAQLARTMRDIIEDRSRYEDMFRWRNHYRYVHSERSDICNLCARLNDDEDLARVTIWKKFRAWWNADPSWCKR